MIASARGDTVGLASVGTAANPNQINTNGHTIPIAKNVSWAPALKGSSWVSFAQTGDETKPEFVLVPAGTIVSFFDRFDVEDGALGGTLRVMAADTATVVLNGYALCEDGWRQATTGENCSDAEIGYKRAATIDLPLNLMHLGSNTLEIRVEIHKGTSFGLDYTGKVDYENPNYWGDGQSYFGSYGDGGYKHPYPPYPPYPPNPPLTVPEPSSLMLLGAGILALAAVARWHSLKKRRVQAR